MVGSAAGNAPTLMGGPAEVVFVDRNADLAVAQAEDVSHALPSGEPCMISAGDYDVLSGGRR